MRAGRSVRGLAGRGTPLVRASSALIITTGLNAVLGLLFWVLAARLYPSSAVGQGAAGVAGMQLVSSFGWFGLQYVLLRYLPIVGPQQRRLLLAVYGGGVAIGALAALIYLLTGHRPLVRDAFSGLAFVGATAAWIIFSLQDPALVGLRRSGWVPVENATFGALKAAALVALAGTASAWAIFGSWAAGAALFAVIVNALVFGKVLRHPAPATGRLPTRRRIARFAGGHHVIAVLLAVPDSLVPLLVLDLLSANANARYYAAWTVGFSLRLVAVNVASALTAEGARAASDIDQLARTAARLAAAMIFPLGLLCVVAAPLVMALFGHGYAGAASLLRLFAAALLPFSVSTFTIALERVRERIGPALVLAVISTGVTLVLDLILIPHHGIDGAGVGWLVAQVVTAAAALVILRREHR